MSTIHINETVPKVKAGDEVHTTRPVRGRNYSIIPANHTCVVEQAVLVGRRYQYLLGWQGVASVWAEDADIEAGKS